MDIILYLTALLQTRKNVGIVGLGTLYKKKLPGKYDAVQHAFVPPSYQLAFTTELKEDEALAKEISSQRNISIESANYYISEFAEKIQAELADHQETDLGALGKLQLIDNEITLISASAVNYGYEFYGLPIVSEIESKTIEELSTAPAKEEALEEIVEENILEEENPGQETPPIDEEYIELNDDQPVFEEIAEVSVPHPTTGNEVYEAVFAAEHRKAEPIIEAQQPEEELVQEDLIEEEEPKKGTSLFIKFLIAFLIIIVAGAIAYFINPKFFDKYIQKNYEGKPITNVPIVTNDSLKLKADSIKADSIAKSIGTAAYNSESTAIDSTKIYYEVIGTSENSEASANKYIARVAKKGIIAKHVKISKLRYSVSLGTFSDQKQALAYQDSLRILLKNPGIYAWPIKPKKHTK